MARVVPLTPANVEAAADVIRAGGLVAFPTETVYGLGGATLDPAPLRAIYALKERPAENPLIAHVADASVARSLTKEWPDAASRLAEAFWPGPLALVLSRNPDVPAVASGGRPTIAVRCPAHEGALAFLRAVGEPVSAPSANRSGRISPTTAAHVADEFPAAEILVLDGGPCPVGVESAVLDLTRTPPRLLRPGAIEPGELAAVVGEIDLRTVFAQTDAPGTSPSHYAPTTPTRLVAAESLQGLLRGATPRAVVVGPADTRVSAPHHLVPMPDDAAAYARALYAALRRADAIGADVVLVVRPPGRGGLWDAVHDRVQRAAAPRG